MICQHKTVDFLTGIRIENADISVLDHAEIQISLQSLIDCEDKNNLADGRIKSEKINVCIFTVRRGLIDMQSDAFVRA